VLVGEKYKFLRSAQHDILGEVEVLEWRKPGKSRLTCHSEGVKRPKNLITNPAAPLHRRWPKSDFAEVAWLIGLPCGAVSKCLSWATFSLKYVLLSFLEDKVTTKRSTFSWLNLGLQPGWRPNKSS
jgi:hypothetical protein